MLACQHIRELDVRMSSLKDLLNKQMQITMLSLSPSEVCMRSVSRTPGEAERRERGQGRGHGCIQG